MGRMTDEEFQGAADALRKAGPESPRLLNTQIKINGAYRQLLKSESAKVVSLSKDVREFRFDSPAFVQRIDVYGQDADRLRDYLSVEAVAIDGARTTLLPRKAQVNLDGVTTTIVRYEVGRVCVSLQVSSLRPILKLKATKIEVVGYTTAQFELLAKKFVETLAIVRRVDEYVEESQSQASEVADRKAKLDEEYTRRAEEFHELEASEEQLTEQLNDLQGALRSASSEKLDLDRLLSAARLDLEAMKNNEKQLSVALDSLNTNIAERRGELARLENDRSLISDEYKDYVREGGRQTIWYVALIMSTLTVMFFSVYQIYVGAKRILVGDIETYEQLAVLSLQRLPFAVALGLVVTLCWKLGAALIARVMTIHAQRLAPARLLVIAKDTVYSSTSGLDVSDDTKFRERIRLKMSMLRSHLTSELGRDFMYAEGVEAREVHALRREEGAARESTADDDDASEARAGDEGVN